MPMPEITGFFGIIGAMFFDEHNPPHFHARCGGDKASIEIESLRYWKGLCHRGCWAWSLSGHHSTERTVCELGKVVQNQQPQKIEPLR